MASQQPPGDSKPLIMDSQQPPADSKTIDISCEKCTNCFTAACWRIQTINHGFATASWRFQNHQYVVVKVRKLLHSNLLDIPNHQ